MAGAKILQRELQIVVGDLDAIDLGEDFRLRREKSRREKALIASRAANAIAPSAARGERRAFLRA